MLWYEVIARETVAFSLCLVSLFTYDKLINECRELLYTFWVGLGKELVWIRNPKVSAEVFHKVAVDNECVWVTIRPGWEDVDEN